MRRYSWLIFSLFFFLLLAGCQGNLVKNEDSTIKLAYISKDLEHYWFQQVKSGIESKCQEKGIKVECFNAEYDDDKCMNLVKKIVKEKYDGLLICTTNQELGEEIGKLCREAEIPVVTIDDSMKDDEDKAFPYVGMATREVGAIGGSALAKMAEEKKFPFESGKVRILEIDVPSLSVFRDRLTGYEEALFTNLALTKKDVVTIEGTTGMYESNYDKAIKYFQDNPPEKDLYWIICGSNDDCALASMHALKVLGVPQEQMIACGLGGYELSIQEFEEENRNYITVMTQPDVEGAQAAEMLYENLVNGKEMDTSIILGGAVATCDNYLIYFDDSNRVEE